VVGCLGDGEDLGMRRWVLGLLHLVVGGGDHFAMLADDSTDGDLALSVGVNGLVVGQTHIKGVIPIELGWVYLIERAGCFTRGVWIRAIH